MAFGSQDAEVFEEVELVQLIKCELHFGVKEAVK